MSDDRHEVEGMIGRQVREVSLDGALVISLGMREERERYPLHIESPAELIDATDATHPFVPLSIAPGDAIASLIGSVLGALVTDLDIRESGSLRITFSNEVAIFVPPDEWEAWMLNTGNGSLASMPGGGLG